MHLHETYIRLSERESRANKILWRNNFVRIRSEKYKAATSLRNQFYSIFWCVVSCFSCVNLNEGFGWMEKKCFLCVSLASLCQSPGLLNLWFLVGFSFYYFTFLFPSFDNSLQSLPHVPLESLSKFSSFPVSTRTIRSRIALSLTVFFSSRDLINFHMQHASFLLNVQWLELFFS